MTGANHAGKKWFTCTACGKRCWPSKSDAKTALRQLSNRNGMHVYRCSDTGEWHFGHARGLSRAEHRHYHERRAS